MKTRENLIREVFQKFKGCSLVGKKLFMQCFCPSVSKQAPIYTPKEQI